jgi:hypothetical protein
MNQNQTTRKTKKRKRTPSIKKSISPSPSPTPSPTPTPILTTDWILYDLGNIFEPLINNKHKINKEYTIPTNTGYFIRRFKWLLMQYPLRKYFVSRIYPDIPYYMIKLDYNDTKYIQKLNFIKDAINKNNEPFIIDLAEQLSEGGGGHWSSLRRRYTNELPVYMDSDPISYGSIAESKHKAFHKLFVELPNPIHIYGDDNTNITTKKSIQNVHYLDMFCQSWSLVFLASNPDTMNYSQNLFFQHGINTFDDELYQFDEFIRMNFMVLIDFWIYLFDYESHDVINSILHESQWQQWSAESILYYLQQLKQWIINNSTETIFKKRNDLFKI